MTWLKKRKRGFQILLSVAILVFFCVSLFFFHNGKHTPGTAAVDSSAGATAKAGGKVSEKSGSASKDGITSATPAQAGTTTTPTGANAVTGATPSAATTDLSGSPAPNATTGATPIAATDPAPSPGQPTTPPDTTTGPTPQPIPAPGPVPAPAPAPAPPDTNTGPTPQPPPSPAPAPKPAPKPKPEPEPKPAPEPTDETDPPEKPEVRNDTSGSGSIAAALAEIITWRWVAGSFNVPFANIATWAVKAAIGAVYDTVPVSRAAGLGADIYLG